MQVFAHRVDGVQMLAFGYGLVFELIDQAAPVFDLCRCGDVVEALHDGADEAAVLVADVRERHGATQFGVVDGAGATIAQTSNMLSSDFCATSHQ